MLHRDDVPFEEAEKIVDALRREHGDMMDIVFSGDARDGEIPEEIRETVQKIKNIEQISISSGVCVSCNSEIENYEPWAEDWSAPLGWMCLVDENGDVRGWRCKHCCSQLGDHGWHGLDDLEADFE